jgi:hypothetical protein
VTQVIVYLPSRHETLSSDPSTAHNGGRDRGGDETIQALKKLKVM